MLWQSCEPQRSYKETSLLYNKANTFPSQLVVVLIIDVQKVALIFIYICRLLSVFLNKSGRICPTKLKLGMLYLMNTTFRHIIL